MRPNCKNTFGLKVQTSSKHRWKYWAERFWI